MKKTKKYYCKLAIAQKSIEELIFVKEKKGKVILFIDPHDKKKEYVIRIETLIVE